MSAHSRAPGLLIATPLIEEPPFYRSVVMLSHHSPEGAHGLILNRSTAHPCAQLCEAFELPWPGPAAQTLRMGGPVERDRVWIVHDGGPRFEETESLQEDVHVSTSRQALEALMREPRVRCQLMVGYAGWGAGQLEREIADGAWLMGELTWAQVFEIPPDDLWRYALARLGVSPEQLQRPTSTMH